MKKQTWIIITVFTLICTIILVANVIDRRFPEYETANHICSLVLIFGTVIAGLSEGGHF